METPAVDVEPAAGSPMDRARRGVALIAVSVLAIGAAAAIYVRPSPSSDAASPRAPAPAVANYRVSAVDFVTPTTGWVVADIGGGDSAVVHTTDGGRSWTPQALMRSDGSVPYLKFFDPQVGVLALTGGAPQLDRSIDGGGTWARVALPPRLVSVMSWSFVDSENGWLLGSDGGSRSGAHLWRTDDAGLSWADLGAPVAAPDEAFAAQMAFLTTGWLASDGSRPYAYRTSDFGATWSRVELPVPPAARRAAGRYFVAVEPLSGTTALASVVFLPAIQGRSGIGATVLGFPPLTVRVYDGGKPARYTYSTAVAGAGPGAPADAPAPNETVLRTLDGGATWTTIRAPATSGAFGFSSGVDFWWIGLGAWSRSDDGGATWSERRPIGVVEPLPGTLRVLDGDHAWFGAAAGPRPLLEVTDDGGYEWRMVMLPPIAAAGYALT